MQLRTTRPEAMVEDRATRAATSRPLSESPTRSADTVCGEGALGARMFTVRRSCNHYAEKDSAGPNQVGQFHLA